MHRVCVRSGACVEPRSYSTNRKSRAVMVQSNPVVTQNAGNVPKEFLPPDKFRETAYIKDAETYREMYDKSINQPEEFWGEIASEFKWEQKWDDSHMSYNFDMRNGPVNIEWFKGGTTNISYNCLDRNIERGLGDSPCFIWEGNEPTDSSTLTYSEVLEEVCRVANWLREQGVQAGDAVAIYLPMVPALPIAMLACARIGAVHSVVFGGFSSESLADRIVNCGAKVLITASGVMRGKKAIQLKQIADEACRISKARDAPVSSVLVLDVKHASGIRRDDVAFDGGRDVWYDDVIPQQPPSCEPLWVPSEHPLFLLYTSGSTGTPKGVQHNTGGYMVYAATTCKYVFNMKPGDVYWCTADCGWITGHTYLTYGPLLNGVASLVFEGVPTYPGVDRCWEVVKKHSVKQFYTAPTAIRSLMSHGDEPVKRHDRSSLEILGTVGEPINPEAWRWYEEVVGESNCPIVDTWWQTETGGHMITPLPGAWAEKPGSATLPFFGVLPAILDPESGKELEGEAEGVLCIKQAWPSTIRAVYGDPDRYEATYFSAYKGYYFSGDGARRDADGYYWITGRVDDVINVSGHRIGTAEVESALVLNPKCAEAAVVGYEHPIKGQGIYAYVSLMDGVDFTDELRNELRMDVRKQIGAFAAPDVVHHAPGLPKTRSGKIMRRILRKVASNEVDQLGDISTLADPSIVQTLIELRPQPS
eukprot:jgi/Ulvmu1/417/UM001_0424.1